ncbi:MAG: hypothetical protein ACI4UU_01830 [Clostridia bacterium]
MGLFNKQKKEVKKPEIKEYKALSTDGLSTIFMFDINTSTIVQYNNDEKTRLVRARIAKYKSKRNTINEKNADHIAFEIQEKQELTPEIMQAAILEYDEQSQIAKYQNIYYLGRCIQSKYGYYFSEMSKDIEDIITNMIKEEEKANRQGIISKSITRSKESNYRNSLEVKNNAQQLKRENFAQRTRTQTQQGLER